MMLASFSSKRNHNNANSFKLRQRFVSIPFISKTYIYIYTCHKLHSDTPKLIPTSTSIQHIKHSTIHWSRKCSKAPSYNNNNINNNFNKYINDNNNDINIDNHMIINSSSIINISNNNIYNSINTSYTCLST